MSKDDGGPAFPSHGSMGEVAHQGMTLRDYFAAAALPQIMQLTYLLKQSGIPNAGEHVRTWGEQAYSVADVMLKERAK